jgi:cell division protein FtsB
MSDKHHKKKGVYNMEILQLTTFLFLLLSALTTGFYAGYTMDKEELEKDYIHLLNEYKAVKNFKEFNNK